MLYVQSLPQKLPTPLRGHTSVILFHGVVFERALTENFLGGLIGPAHARKIVTNLPEPLNNGMVGTVAVLVNSVLPPVVDIDITQTTHEQLHRQRKEKAFTTN